MVLLKGPYVAALLSLREYLYITTGNVNNVNKWIRRLFEEDLPPRKDVW